MFPVRLAPFMFTFLLAALWAGPSHGLNPLFDGGFESGTLQGWAPGESGSAIVVSRGTCFADDDTTTLSIRGRYAGLLRSIKNIKDGEPASLTSKPFIAGDAVVFLALSEQLGRTPKQHPFALNVSILDAAGTVLETKAISTALARLSKGCPSASNDSSFSQHFMSTRPYAGKQIRLRYSHHPDLAKEGAFTLVDEVSIVKSGETPIFQSSPIAKAGFSFENNQLFLLPALPDGDIEQTRDWQFSWLINGESTRRPYFNPCINDLDAGDYTANLYVRQNERLVTDTLHFTVPYIIFSQTPIDSDEAGENDDQGNDTDSQAATSTPVTTDGDSSSSSITCNARHPLDIADQLDSSDNPDDSTDPDSPVDPPGNPVDPIDPVNPDTNAPVVSTLDLNDPFVTNLQAILFTDVGITSDGSLKLASITLDPAQSGDRLIKPTTNELGGLSFSCSNNETVCELSGDASVDIFRTAILAIDIEIGSSGDLRTVTVTVTDNSDQISNSASESFTPFGS